MLLIRFVHYLGVAMWIGGTLAVLLFAASANKESAPIRASVYRRMVPVHTKIIGIGVLLTIGSGILWSMRLVQANGPTSDPMPLAFWVMVLTGFVGGALVLFVVMPTAVRLGRAANTGEERELPSACERYQSRLSMTTTLACFLAVVSLVASVAAT